MAKRTIKTAITEIINPTKDMTISFKNANVANGSKLIFDGNSTPIASANGKDLCIVTLSGNITGGDASCVVTTIKNYFKYAHTNINLVTVGTSEISAENMEGDEILEVCAIGKGVGYVLGKKKITGMLATSLGGKNATKYDISSLFVDGFLIELGGNDKYTYRVKYENADTKLRITDISGNDKYTLINESFTNIYDQKGNDKYTLNTGRSTITDYAGKDKYTLNNTTDSVIDDKAGKDKYTISNTTKLKLEDYAGNDKYTFNNVSNADEYGDQIEGYHIKDFLGNDKYTVKGADTNIVLTDNTGKDTYNIKGSYNKKKKLTTYVGHTEVQDTGDGKNTFNVTYGKDTYLNTDSAENVYNIKNSVYTKIESKTSLKFTEGVGSKDKYNLTSNEYYEIYDFGTSNDTYKFKKSATGFIQDNGGDDTYTIDKLNFKRIETEDTEIHAGLLIKDIDGNDTLTLKGSKKQNLVFMSDFHKYEDNYISYNNSLIIYDKSTKGYAYIEEFFADSDDDYNFDGYGEGKMETIKAKIGKKVKPLDITTNDNYYTNLNSVKEDVVNWLTTQSNEGIDFGCVEDVLMYGTNEQKATLVTYFDGTHQG